MQVTLGESELQAWRRLDNAAKAIQVAQPAGMSEAAKELAEARRELESVMLSAMTAWLGNTPGIGAAQDHHPSPVPPSAPKADPSNPQTDMLNPV